MILSWGCVRLLVFTVTFSNCSAISWLSNLLVSTHRSFLLS